MGKRELLIIIAFVIVGAVAYQVTAPPPKPGERSFSLRQIFSGLRREMSANNASATVTKSGTIPLGPDITEVRVAPERNVPLTVLGEDREDIAYEMPVQSTGPDEATARSYAERSVLRQDDLGSVLGLATKFPEEGTQTAQLTLHVPRRLTVRVENSSRIHVTGVSVVDLRNVVGETTVTSVGSIVGSHRSGDLTVTEAENVELALSSSRARIRDVTHLVQINARNGECTITNGTGAVTLTAINAELTVAGHEKGTIKVSGEGGRFKLTGPLLPLQIDVRRMLVEIEAAGVASGEITVITTDEPLRLTLSADAAVSIDAIATDSGEIQAADFEWTPAKQDKSSRLTATLGHGGARILLRNARGNIVITRRK